MAETGTMISRIYGGFRGVDFRGEEVNLSRSPDSVNMWRNYRETESIETRPDLKVYYKLSSIINGIYFLKGTMYVHNGAVFSKLTKSGSTITRTNLYTSMANAKSNGIVYGERLYILDGKSYYYCDGTDFKVVEGYIPSTVIGSDGLGTGSTYQDVNLLCGTRQVNTFRGRGGGQYKYYVSAPKIYANGVVVRVYEKVGEEWQWNERPSADYSVKTDEGMIEFVSGKEPDKPLTEGQDNISIEFVSYVEGKTYDQAKSPSTDILYCTMLQVFDNRIFVSGNPTKPNRIWHCSIDNPAYFSASDYYDEGLDTAKVTGMAVGNNAIWVFREPTDTGTSVFYHTPAMDDTYGKIYPSSHSSIALGCEGQALNFNDDLIFFSQRGMEGISGDIATEQMAAHRSSLVDRKLMSEKNYKDMILEEWRGYLLVIVPNDLGSHIYLADSRALFTNENHAEYEWFYWEFNKVITCVKEYDGVLYVGAKDGVYELSGETNVTSWWVTPKDKFGVANKTKTTLKKGCVVEAFGEVTLSAKTDADIAFDDGETFNEDDFFTCRIRKKKFKDIQLKFYSKTRFRLETATLEAIVGGYIKGR